MSAALKLFTPTDWSQEQLIALEKINHWRRSESKSYMTLGGYAGTGKSTLIAHLANEWRWAAVCAFTGKAASVLRKKGVRDAQTIHSLIYAPFEGYDGKVKFRKKKEIEASIIIVDEASMVGKWLHGDLQSFGVPILYIGDHGQLEPIGDSKHDLKLMAEPTIRLETIHRQAADNPILRLAAAFREGRDEQVMRAHKGGYRDASGRLKLVGKSTFRDHLDNQVICGTNKTRHEVNQLIRGKKGFAGNMPNVGETVICLQNNKQWQVFNGQLFTVTNVGRMCKYTDIMVKSEDGREVGFECLLSQFGAAKTEDHKEKSVVLLDFGYCLTCHKAQGSESENITVIDEQCSLWDARRWRYTAVTRAKERLVYCG